MKVSVDEFAQAYGGNMTLAAEKLGCTRQVIYWWKRRDGQIPDPWVYKAHFLIHKKNPRP